MRTRHSGPGAPCRAVPNPRPALESVEADTKRGWITRGRPFPPTIPYRMVAKNVVDQHTWRIDDEGQLVSAQKWRVTTDDSMDVDEVQSRNHTMDKEAWPDMGLPGPRSLGEAVAIVKAAAGMQDVKATQATCEQIALWALDLSDTYRRCRVNRAEWWQQAFVWHDGVRLDKRPSSGRHTCRACFRESPRLCSEWRGIASVRSTPRTRTHQTARRGLG